MALPPPPKKDSNKDPKSIANAQDEAKKALMDVVPKDGAPVSPAAPALLPPQEPADDDITKGAPRAIIVAEPGEDAPQEETKVAPADAPAPAADEPTPAGPPAPVAPPAPEPAAFVGPPATREEEARMVREEEERKAREAKEKERREKEAEKARWFEKNQASVDEAALNPEKHYATNYDFTGVENRKWEMDQVTMRSYVQLHNEGTQHAITQAEWDSQRADTARKRFGGRGAESDEEFLQEIVKESQGRKDAKDYEDHSNLFINARAAFHILEPKAENPYSYERYADEMRKLPAHDEVAMLRDSLTWEVRVQERIQHLSPRRQALISVMDGVDGDTPEARVEAIKALTSPESPIQTFMREYSPRPSRATLRKAFLMMVETHGLLPAFTSAASHAKDKNIRRNPDQSWDLPYMKPIKSMADGMFVSPTLGPIQSSGGRNDLPLANNDPEGTQAALTKFQQEHQIPDSVMIELWSDGVNEFRPWDEGEKVRVLSDGMLQPNPNASEWLDSKKAIEIILSAPAPQDAKAHALRILDQTQNAMVLGKYKTYSGAAIMGNLTELVLSHFIDSVNPRSPYHPDEWAKRHNRTDVLTPGFFLDYEKDLQNRAWIESKGEALEIDFIQGGAGLTSGFGGLIGSISGSETIVSASQDLHEFSTFAEKGQAKTGVVGMAMEQAIPVMVDLLTMKAATTSGTLLFRGSAKAGAVSKFVTMPLIAGSQNFGTAYLEAMREKDATHEKAKEKAWRAGAATVILAVSFGAASGEAKMAFSGVEKDKITVGMLFNTGSREETIRNLEKFSVEMFGSLSPKLREEAVQQLSATFINVDPNTKIADAWDNYTKALGKAVMSKSMGELTDRMGKSTSNTSDESARSMDLPPAKAAAGNSSPEATARTKDGAIAKTDETKAIIATEPAAAPPKAEAKASGKEVKPAVKTEKGAAEKSTTKAGTNTKPKPEAKPATKKTTKPKAKPAAEKPSTPPKKQTKKKNPRPKRGGTKKLRYGRENKPDEE